MSNAFHGQPKCGHRQTEVMPPAETQHLHGDVPLVVVHSHHTIELAFTAR